MSDDLKAQFEQAALDVKTLKAAPDNDTLLQLYSLYKQGTSGDVTGKRPGRLSPVKRAKYDAWDKLKGRSKDDAQSDYVSLVNRLTGA